MSYERSDDNEEIETVLTHNKNNNDNFNKVNNYESNPEAKAKLFEGRVENEIKVTPKNKLNTKGIQAMKNFQASYNEDANKIVEQAAIVQKKILIFVLT